MKNQLSKKKQILLQNEFGKKEKIKKPMHNDLSWQYNEFKQVGKDYTRQEEVDVYDSTHSDFRDVEKENEAILKAINIQKSDVIIDFGSGTGAFAIQAASRCTKVIAVDVSEPMIHFAQTKVEKSGRTNIEFFHAGFLTYQHEDEPVDTIVTSLAFHHLPDFWKGLALQRMFRMLKQGGTLFLRDVVIGTESPVETIQSFIDQQEVAGGDFLREDAEQHFGEEFSTYDWIMEGLLERTGFAIENKEMNDGVFATYLCKKK